LEKNDSRTKNMDNDKNLQGLHVYDLNSSIKACSSKGVRWRASRVWEKSNQESAAHEKIARAT